MLTRLAHRPLPTPPESLRRGPFREWTPSPPHDVRTAALLGRLLGIGVLICFLTGLISHLHQSPPDWLDVPSRPVWGYQLTQGLHVATGIALIPIVLAKLWVVYRRLFAWPPAATLLHAAERGLVAVLVAGTLFELVTGMLNVVQWYAFPFFFPRTHFAVAWLVVGAVLVHLAAKAPQIRAGLAKPVAAKAESDAGREESAAGPGEPIAGAGETVAGMGVDPDRRAVLLGVGGAVAAVTVATLGQTVRPLHALSVLAPRDPTVGEQGVPVNRTAAAAGIASAANDPGWRLTVAGATPLALSLADLMAMPQHEAVLPIACVEGWSATARWAGVRLRDLLDAAAVPTGAHVRAVSLEAARSNWLYATSPIGPSLARDPLTLLALRLDGAPLALDHGYPLRLIGPNRPGVQQTKWLSRIEVV